jgi:glycosyltransferase involved in cell wall biosynthesis
MISIVVPTYNRLASLQNCVESILQQFYEGLELVIIDDRSTDDTGAYLQNLQREHNFIRVLFNNVNQGVNYSRNQGIKAATRPYILFIDSDDKLSDGSLVKVRQALTENPARKHFLFNVSDRSEEFKGLEENKDILYADWVSGRVSGDFTHVIDAATMKQYLFFEHFRMYEHLNWLRVKKTTSPQLFVPVIVADRDRDRSDSLTLHMKLKNVSVIRTKFESEKLYYSLYYNDLRLHNPQSLKKQLLHAIMLGTACNQRNDCRSMLKYGPFPVKVMALGIMCFPSSLLQYGIARYSALKSRHALAQASLIPASN